MDRLIPTHNNLIRFTRYLRQQGWPIGLAQTQDALECAQTTLAQSDQMLRLSLKITLCTNKEEWNSFDQTFDKFWSQKTQDTENQIKLPPGRAPTRKIQKGLVGFSTSVENDEAENNDPTMGGAGTSSGVGKTDFRFLTDRRAYQQAAKITERLARRIKKKPSRRWKTVSKGPRVHAQATLRSFAKHGDLNTRLIYKKRKTIPHRLVMVLDVSHSMSYYSPVLARFVRALCLSFPKSEAFCFHVDLHRITHLLKEHKPEKLVENFEKKNGLWFGGTKISESLSDLMNRYKPNLSPSRTTLLLFSDGFDTMSADELTLVLKKLRSNVKNLYWIDPNLTRAREAGLEEEGALHEAQQWIDDVIPGDSLAGLEELVIKLQK